METVLNALQLKCLSSPVRNEVHTAIRSRGRASVAELSGELGRSAESLHYHVRSLVEAGLIQAAGKRQTRRIPEVIYEPVYSALRLPKTAGNPELAALSRKAVLAGLRQTMRGFERASKQAEVTPETRNGLHVIRAVMRLKPEDLARVVEKIEEAVRLAKSLDSPEGTRFQWSSVVFPEIRS